MIAMKIVALICWVLTMAAVSLATMIYGWGLEPQNWWWIIGGYFVMFAGSISQGITAGLSDK